MYADSNDYVSKTIENSGTTATVQEVNINGRKVKRFTITAPKYEEKWLGYLLGDVQGLICPGEHAYTIIPNKAGGFYVLIYFAPIGKSEKYQKYYDEMVSSFKLLTEYAPSPTATQADSTTQHTTTPLDELAKVSEEFFKGIGEEVARAKINEAAGNQTLADPLQKLLNDPSDKVRASSAEAFGKICDDNAVNTLRISLYDPNERVKESVTKALIQSHAPIADDLKKDGKLQEALEQYIADLKIMTDFYTGKTQGKLQKDREIILREKIIKLAQEMDPPPVVPDEAERFMVRGATAVKVAEDVNGFKDAVAEFEKATLAAPWLANAYYNLGIVQDKAGLYESAIQSLKLYLLAAPNAADAKEIKRLIYEIDFRKDKAVKDKEAKKEKERALAEQEAQRLRQEKENLVKSLDGARYTNQYNNEFFESIIDRALDIKGETMVWSRCTRKQSSQAADPDPIGVWVEIARMPIINRQSEYDRGPGITAYTFIISEDGKSITARRRGGDADIYYREK
jgi:tetratricopeptide (TPR) repeat protein